MPSRRARAGGSRTPVFAKKKRLCRFTGRAGTLENKAGRKEARPAARTCCLSVMHRLVRTSPEDALRSPVPPLPCREEQRHLSSSPGHVTTAVGCGVCALPGKQGSLCWPCPEERGEGEAGARRLHPTLGMRRGAQAHPCGPLAESWPQSCSARGSGPGGPLPASRRAAPSSTVPESSCRGMVLPAGAQGCSPAEGGEAGAGGPAGLRRALLGPGRFPRRRRR